MAVRLNKRQAETARSHIKANRVIEELQRYFHGEREMTMGQIRAAQILLDKSMPSLKASEINQVQDVQIELVSYDNHPALVIEHETKDTIQ